MDPSRTVVAADVEDDPRLWIAGAALPALIHVAAAILFYALGETAYGHADVVAVLVHLTGMAFILGGRRFVGIWVVIGSAMPHVAFMVVALGWESGWAYYFFGILLLPFLFFRKHTAHMAVAVTLGVTMAIAAVVGTYLVSPFVRFDAQVLDLMHGVNLVATLLATAGAGFVIIQASRQQQRELARLRAEVLEARKLGQYTLGEPIGAGGMGQVYRAHHALLRRPAAIKLIKGDEVSETAMRRFEREVQRTSELSHPNTVAIFDYGRTPEGVFYYVMELLDGLDLEELVGLYGPLPPERVVHILRQAAEALEEAHERGLVHRDIKPANLQLCRLGGRPDVIKVLDFGLVMEVGESNDASETAIAGTPAYMAPEAVQAPESVGPAADLYALGAVGYFLLSGQRVFEEDSFTAMCAAHVGKPPPPLSERTADPVPEVLEELIMDCLQKDRSHRPKSARAFRHGLDVVELERGWTEERARAWWAKHDELEATRPSAEPEASASRGVPVERTIDAGALRRAP